MLYTQLIGHVGPNTSVECLLSSGDIHPQRRHLYPLVQRRSQVSLAGGGLTEFQGGG